jgi:hypothetical protein
MFKVQYKKKYEIETWNILELRRYVASTRQAKEKKAKRMYLLL